MCGKIFSNTMSPFLKIKVGIWKDQCRSHESFHMSFIKKRKKDGVGSLECFRFFGWTLKVIYGGNDNSHL